MSVEAFADHEQAVAAVLEAETDPLRRGARLAAMAGEQNAEAWREIAADLGAALNRLGGDQELERRALRRGRTKALEIARKASALQADMARLLELTEPTSADRESRHERGA